MSMKRLMLATLATLMTVGGMAGPALAAGAPRTENVTIIFTFPASGPTLTGRAIGTGAVTGVGTATSGEGDVFPVTIAFPQGTINAVVTSGPTDARPNFKACVDSSSGTDTIQITGGTGAFAGASGSGTDTNQGVIVLPRNPNGTCNPDGAPVAGFIIVRAILNLT